MKCKCCSENNWFHKSGDLCVECGSDMYEYR